jgi:hypothetical protein
MNVMHENHNVKRIWQHGKCVVSHGWNFDGIQIFLKKSNSTLYAPWTHPSSTSTITTSMQIH